MNVEDNDHFDFGFKIVLIGDAGVGKTCIVQRFKSGVWVESQASTIGVDFCMKTCLINEKKVKLQLWDTAGQERFRTITQSYYRSAHGVVCAFDLTRRASFNNVDRWIEDVTKYCSEDVAVLLVGNKCDLEENRQISHEEAIALGKCYNAVEYIETSAKDNTNIDDSFLKIASVLLEKHSTNKLNDDFHNTSFGLGSGGKSRAVRSDCSC